MKVYILDPYIIPARFRYKSELAIGSKDESIKPIMSAIGRFNKASYKTMLRWILIILVNPRLGARIRDKDGYVLFDEVYVTIAETENDGLYEEMIGEAYRMILDRDKKTVSLWNSFSSDKKKTTISVTLFIALLQRVAKEQEEFKKDPEAYEKEVKAGKKVFEVREEDVNLDKMIEEFKETYKKEIKSLERSSRSIIGKLKFWKLKNFLQ